MLNLQRSYRAKIKFSKAFGLIMASAIILLAFAAIGQNTASRSHQVSVVLPAIALLDIEPSGNTIELGLDEPLQAGLPVIAGSSSTDNTLWLNYTSAVTNGGPSRNVSVYVDGGVLPGGLLIKVQAAAYTGIGAGTLGTPLGVINLNSFPQTLISGIRGAYTGDGVGNGHQLNYSIEINNYGEIIATSGSDLIITYTITDN
jgi:hypothetical protein